MTESDDAQNTRAHDPVAPESGEEASHEDEQSPEARVHVSRWPAWIWIVPLLAIFVVGFLVVRYGFFGGRDVTVRFADARGLERYSPVRFKGAKVGTVQKISIDEELEEVVVRISLDAQMNHALRSGTHFWIVEPGLEGGGLGSLLSGTYVALAPGDGEEATEFQGQEYAPILQAPEDGKTVIVHAESLGSLSAGSPVHFEGVRVGRVLGAEHDDANGAIAVHVFVSQRFADRVRQSTRFWRSGGLSISLGGGGISMGDASLSSLLTGGISFYTPEVLAGPPVPELTRFELHDSEARAIAAADGPHMTYLANFPGPIGGLTPGTPVQMKGVQVGRVREVRLRYVDATSSLETPVTIEIDPRRLELDVLPKTTRDELRGRMNDVMGALVRRGMRARLSTSLVLPGAGAVTLDMVGAPGTARLGLNTDPPTIPAVAGGDGLQDALGAVGRITDRIENFPLEQIAGDLRGASQRVNALVNDPRLESTLESVSTAATDVRTAAGDIRTAAGTAQANIEPIAQSLQNAATSVESASRQIQSLTGRAGESLDPIMESLGNAAASAESAASRAEQLLGSSAKQNYDLAELIRELTRAAEAVRALSTYLTENPDSLLRGRRE